MTQQDFDAAAAQRGLTDVSFTVTGTAFGKPRVAVTYIRYGQSERAGFIGDEAGVRAMLIAYIDRMDSGA